jgi:hypothetical protein
MRAAGYCLKAVILLLIAVYAATLRHESHLVVLAHGIMGTANDLTVLAQELRQRGCAVLESNSNERLQSLYGVEQGATKLAYELQVFLKDHPEVSSISFVGNSLGGIYVRKAVKILFSDMDHLVNTRNLKANKFMTIASPHLGVYDYTFLDEYKLPFPKFVKNRLVNTAWGTLKDLADTREGSLLHTMGTRPEYVESLRRFQKRRLYANLNRDFVVPFGTAAFIKPTDVWGLRAKHLANFGIVEQIDVASNAPQSLNSDDPVEQMRYHLDSLGWEKVIVNFPGVLPDAHNKIAALRNETRWQCGFSIMRHAADWLTEDVDL